MPTSAQLAEWQVASLLGTFGILTPNKTFLMTNHVTAAAFERGFQPDLLVANPTESCCSEMLRHPVMTSIVNPENSVP